MSKKVLECSHLLFESYLGEKGTAVASSPDGSLFVVGTAGGCLFFFGRFGSGWRSCLLPNVCDGEILRVKVLSENVVCFIVNNDECINFVSWKGDLFSEDSAATIASRVTVKKEFAARDVLFSERSFGNIHTFDVAQYGRLCWLGCSGVLILAKFCGVTESSWDSLSLSCYNSFNCFSGMVFSLNSRLDGQRVIYSTSDNTSLHVLDVEASKLHCHTSYHGHEDWITSVKIGEANENLFISGDSSGQVCFWDSRCGEPLVASWPFFRSITFVDLLSNPLRMMLAFGPHEDYIIENEEPHYRGVLFSYIDLRKCLFDRGCCEQRQVKDDETFMGQIVSSCMEGDQVVAMDMDGRKSRIMYTTNDGYIRVASSRLLEEQFTQLLPCLRQRELGV
ncbi:ribosome assembly protein 4 (RSA4) [Galdieria sulphuraria]|uniref:Ribosome assembly protein 4 (RSA4) n=1 Tax=Galdieria sulphuraria TaxID=130081 RepID=M2WXP9_GALSU|nr:ribosome assembly protein 4 (RSA4) [Galdieria sulphuraria]EME28830.1 ribosome assembly protein 4 (RSA4) [Galdieria sulphuraria]|eukprot:XP_005705350.1 ribosome assembly protein 4 (RSA4) [Galdieria sulphuraria]